MTPTSASPATSASSSASPVSDPTQLQLADCALGHMMVVGGTFQDWSDLGADRWQQRVVGLGAIVASAGGSWLTLRAYERGDRPVELTRWSRTVTTGGDGDCTVIVDPCADGRQRFADAMAGLDASTEVNEAVVAQALYEPADCEPDVVLILGPPTQLPPSLVWELAYAELVFLEVPWDQLAQHHLVAAINDFAGRRRRFGGLDP